MRAILLMMALWMGVTQASAEYILLEYDSRYEAYMCIPNHLNIQAYDNNTQQAFKVLQRYAWPTVSIYFETFTPAEKEDYLRTLREQEHGVTRFINKKLKEIDQKYYAYFVPDDLIALAALAWVDVDNPKDKISAADISGSLMDSIGGGTREQVLQSAFGKFATTNNRDFTLNLQAERELWNTISLEHFIPLNKIPDFDLEENRFVDFIPAEAWKKIISNLVKLVKANQIKMAQLNNPKKSEKEIDEIAAASLAKIFVFDKENFGSFGRLAKGTESTTNSMEEVIFKTINFAFEAERRNNFLLFRGAGINKTDIKGHVPSTYKKQLYDLESKEDFALPLAVDLSGDKLQSLSFGNTLLAGSMFENSAAGARALGYAISKKTLYGLEIPIADYLDDNVQNVDGSFNLNHPRNLFYIAPFATIPSLFAEGEIFHSRSKLSSDFALDAIDQDGFRIRLDGWSFADSNTKNVLIADQADKLGLFSIPNTKWDTDMMPHLEQFIADHLVVFYTDLKRDNGKKSIRPKEIETAQKGILRMKSQGVGADAATIGAHERLQDEIRHRHQEKH